MTLTTSAFDWVRGVVEADAAIVLEPGKEYLVESRLAALARQAGASSVSAYLEQVRPTADRRLRQQLVEALTTNETSWFRDPAAFEMFEQTILPELRRQRAATRQVRVWSAACSTGQEPYSLAMLLRETLAAEGWRSEIVGTDIDESVLAKAREGVYSQLEINRGLPAGKLVAYFTRSGTGWRVNDSLRPLVSFTRLNLATALPPTLGRFDVIFLRNVLIYFSIPTRQAILQRIRAVCHPGAYLVLGSAETTLGIDDGWERMVVGRATCYRPRS